MNSAKAKAAKNKHLVRQDRISTVDLNAFVVHDGREIPLINYSSFGVALYYKDAERENTVFKGAKLVMEGHLVATVDLKHVRNEALPEGGFKVAFEITSDPLDVDQVSTFPAVWKIVTGVAGEAEKLNTLPGEFVDRVFRIKDSFQQLEKQVTELQRKQEFLSKAQIASFESMVTKTVGAAIFNMWQQHQERLAKLIVGAPEETQKSCFNFFREQMKGLLYQSPFATRTLAKPRGYAGDFEMMNLIYRNNDMGESLFGRCVENSFLASQEPQAVRNRVEFMLNHILSSLKETPGKKVRILSVASGPAAEVQKLVEVLSQEELSRLEIFLLDQDEGSLKHAQKEVRTAARFQGKNISVSLLNYAIKDVVIGSLEEEPFDLIYSAGLFDYFTDPVAHMAGKALLKHVTPKGRVVIGNFDVSSPNRFLMTLVFDWNLIYRSRADLQRIFTYPASRLRVEQEKLGINLFCVIEKPLEE